RLFDLGLGAFADADGEDDGADADDHAERRQERAHLVAHERAQGDAQRVQDAHAASSGGSSATAAAASFGFCRVSDMTCPSRMTTTRAAYSAMSGSCVTRTTMMPSRPSAWNSAMTSTLVRESRLPVGSSARMTLGRP